jgi:hypothetical protein
MFYNFYFLNKIKLIKSYLHIAELVQLGDDTHVEPLQTFFVGHLTGLAGLLQSK